MILRYNKNEGNRIRISPHGIINGMGDDTLVPVEKYFGKDNGTIRIMIGKNEFRKKKLGKGEYNAICYNRL